MADSLSRRLDRCEHVFAPGMCVIRGCRNFDGRDANAAKIKPPKRVPVLSVVLPEIPAPPAPNAASLLVAMALSNALASQRAAEIHAEKHLMQRRGRG